MDLRIELDRLGYRLDPQASKRYTEKHGAFCFAYAKDGNIVALPADPLVENERWACTLRKEAEIMIEKEKINMGGENKHYRLIEGSLLDSDATYIAHQTNCTSKGAAGGIAKALFERFPHANSYAERAGHTPPMLGQMPGDVEIRGGCGGQRLVLNLYAQFHSGGPSGDPKEADRPLMRAQWFSECLEKIATWGLPRGTSIALPHNVGCGIGGGNWDKTYEPMINEFAQRMARKGVEIRLYRKDSE